MYLKTNIFVIILMPSEDTPILDFNQCKNADKTPFIIYWDLECLIEKNDECKDNPKISSTTKIVEHVQVLIFYNNIV